MGLKLLVYDGTAKQGERPLRASWAAGARLYRALGRVDAYVGAQSWTDALAWCLRQPGDEPIEELQFWGHGKWGEARIAEDRLGISSFDADHPHAPLLHALRARLLPRGGSLVWFRTCETFGARPGHRFAERLTRELDVRAAGHTFVIGALQSGLHGLRPGEVPTWSDEEGLSAGTADAPRAAHDSAARAPNTIHFMNGRIPERFFSSVA